MFEQQTCPARRTIRWAMKQGRKWMSSACGAMGHRSQSCPRWLAGSNFVRGKQGGPIIRLDWSCWAGASGRECQGGGWWASLAEFSSAIDVGERRRISGGSVGGGDGGVRGGKVDFELSDP